MSPEIYRIKELITKLNYYTKEYDKGQPQISDKEWDNLYFELEKLEKETDIVYPNSPTQKVNFETVSELKKVKHNHLMLSLDKTKNPEEIASFVSGQEWCAMFKMDGLTASLKYIGGKLVSAETRGNGVEGEDITHNAFVIDNIPKTIPTKEEIIVDGEIICDYIHFSKFESDYKNPRNFAAGSIRQLSSAETATRDLSFVAWDLIKGFNDIDFFAWRLEKLDELGFTTVPRVCDAETVDDAIQILNDMRAEKPYGTYPIDGYVFRFESQKYYESCGKTDHHFRGAMAFKFYDEEYETKLLDIEWSMGRTGQITPIAIFKSIEIDGTIVSRASMHNLSIMRETLGEFPEQLQKIYVAKMNQIIPQITRAEYRNDTIHDHILNNGLCTICPICGELTKIVESNSGVLNVVCGNPSCEGKLANRIDHYAGKKGLDIKGLSIKTIEKLIDWNWINGLKDIYGLEQHRVEWESKPGFGKASVSKILNAIDTEGRHTELESFISAIGIPLVGRSVAKEIVKYYTTWEDFRNAVGGDWTEFEGFGPEISRSINNFDYSEIDEIAAFIDFKQPEIQTKREPAAASAIKDKVFCITGKMVNYKNRDLLKEEIESLGGKVGTSVTTKTNYLINNDINSNSSKNKKAKELGIPIITEEDYIKMKS